tara:strand:+ start:503 stop:964 length:462 start_codon:yes stop_codon:yes gene_type:complete
MTENKSFKTMLLINTVWQMKKTFKMIPISKDCPYIECIYDPASGMLAIVLDKIKETYHMLPKLDENGDQTPVKGRPRPEGQKIKEERRLVATYGEVYIADPKDQQQIIELFAINTDVFDYKSMLSEAVPPKTEEDCPDCDKKAKTAVVKPMTT